jgi:hypothetical protein
MASALVLRRRFRMSQILGVIGVLAGVLLSLAPVLGNANLGGEDVILNSVLFGCSSLFIAFAIVLKEIALNGRPRSQKVAQTQKTESNPGHQGESPAPSAASGLQATRTFDIFVVNSFSSLMQMLATIVLLPLMLFLTPVPGGGWLYIRTGLQADVTLHYLQRDFQPMRANADEAGFIHCRSDLHDLRSSFVVACFLFTSPHAYT